MIGYMPLNLQPLSTYNLQVYISFERLCVFSVSCKSKRPKVSLYIDDQLSWEGTDSSNTVKVPSDTSAELKLTCSVEHAKPAVNISWFVWFPVLKRWEEIPAKPRVQPASCETG